MYLSPFLFRYIVESSDMFPDTPSLEKLLLALSVLLPVRMILRKRMAMPFPKAYALSHRFLLRSPLQYMSFASNLFCQIGQHYVHYCMHKLLLIKEANSILLNWPSFFSPNSEQYRNCHIQHSIRSYYMSYQSCSYATLHNQPFVHTSLIAIIKNGLAALIANPFVLSLHRACGHALDVILLEEHEQGHDRNRDDHAAGRELCEPVRVRMAAEHQRIQSDGNRPIL